MSEVGAVPSLQAPAERFDENKVTAICILDAGAQFGGLIDRNIRELGVRSDILPLNMPADELMDYQAIVISGGPNSVQDENAPHCDPAIFSLGKPILGICYGMQEITYHLGGEVGPSSLREDGPQETTFFGDSKLLNGLEGTQRVLMSHGDSVKEPPLGFRVVGGKEEMVSVIEDPSRQIYGTQFHPEVFQTVHGKDIFANFLFGIANLEKDFTSADQEQEAIDHLQTVVKGRPAVVALSGGVDSAVVSAFVERSLPNNHYLHVDNGFMRSGESAKVMKSLEKLGVHVELLERAETFYNATATRDDGSETPPLNQVISPKDKRRIIGDTFTRVFQDWMLEKGLGEEGVIIQGTLRPDLIESASHLASSRADVIKEHHNDTPLIRALRAVGRVADPFQALYKDQVRIIGRRLGLPPEIVERHPFPGPGLAVRILCALEAYRIHTHDQVQASLDQLVSSEGYARNYRAHLLPVQTVGVQGDARSYKYLVGVEGAQNWEELSKLASTITNRIHDVNRVCYVFGGVDRSDLGITQTLLTPDTIDQIRQADDLVTETLLQHELMSKISQMPVVSFPVHFGEAGKRSVALRPFITPDWMTGIAAQPGRDLPLEAVAEMVQRIMSEVPGIARVVYDLSSKPPGTTEWE